MRATTSSVASLLALALFSAQTSAFDVVLTNKCTKPIVLFDSRTTADIAAGASLTRTIAPNSGAHVFRDSTSGQATLAEFSGDGGMAWFDISIIPTGPKSGPKYCESLDACKALTGGVGFNTPMQIAPKNPNSDRCRVLTCMADGCTDAYQYPKDDTKTHACPINTDFEVTFCPGGSGGATPAPTTKTPTPPPTTQAPTPPPTTEAPTPTPTPTPEPTPTPTEELERSLPDGSGSKGYLRSGSSDNNAGEDRSIEDNDVPETVAPVVTIVDEPTDTPVANEADHVVNAGDKAAGVQTVTTRSEEGSGSSGGIFLVAIVGAVGVVAATAIVVVRRKKAELDALDDKTPVATTSSNDRHMMTTPSGSCIL